MKTRLLITIILVLAVGVVAYAQQWPPDAWKWILPYLYADCERTGYVAGKPCR